MAGKAASWQTVFDSVVDVALLQEAFSPPDDINNEFIVDWIEEWTKAGLSWRAAVAGLAASNKIEFTPIKTQPLGGRDYNALIVSRPGSLAAANIRIR